MKNVYFATLPNGYFGSAVNSWNTLNVEKLAVPFWKKVLILTISLLQIFLILILTMMIFLFIPPFSRRNKILLKRCSILCER